MKIDVLTLFPELYSVFNSGILGKALEKGLFLLNIVNIRDYSADKHKRCDDTPFGGGAGMVMTPQPLTDAIRAADPNHEAKRIYLSPKGKVLKQDFVRELAKEERILLVNGAYEGIDQRVIDAEIDAELSVGDYVLTSGDFASLVVIDAVSRYIPGVLGKSESVEEESFSDGYLEYPHYTRPQNFEGRCVPEVLLNGNHKEIEKWRRAKSLEITELRRPDLLKEQQ